MTTLEDTARIARRVLGSAYPLTEGIEVELRKARALLRDRERDDEIVGGDAELESIREAVAAMTAEEARELLRKLETRGFARDVSAAREAWSKRDSPGSA